MIEKSLIKKILIIKLRAIGDVMLSTVVINNLRAAFPGAEIHFLAEHPSKQVLEGHPNLDNIHIFNSRRENGLTMLLNVRKQRYDLVIDLFGNPRSALLTLCSGARYRVGYTFNWRQYCYNILVKPRGREVHNIDFNLDALRSIDVPIVDRSLSFAIDEHSHAFAERFFREAHLDSQAVVALNAGGGWLSKRWKLPHFARLGDMIAREFSSYILLLWGPGEEEYARQIRSMMQAQSVLIPPSDLKQLAAMLKRCSALVTNDSGPMHIAATVGVPVVAIFGPTNPELQGPVGTRHEIVQNNRLVCLGCNYTKCPIGNPCMEELSPEEIFTAFKTLMLKTPVVTHTV